LKATDMHQHFLSIAEWVDPADTVDRIIIGDPETEVRRVLVTWMSTFDAVRAAATRGCQMLITHEPTFWVHSHELEAVARDSHPIRRGLAARKKQFIEDHRLVILRVHDTWDGMPDIGIPWAWARYLELGTQPAATDARRLHHRYDVEPVKLDTLARRVAEKTAAFGESAVQVVGDGDCVVAKVGVGTGCYCSPLTFQELGCDVSIVCDDGNWYWENLQCAADNDHPIIRVNHASSEEPGMVTLTQYVNDTFPEVVAEHLPHGSCFRLVGRV